MLRPVGPDALVRLRHAATLSDAILDLELLRVGVLAPADLSDIRVALSEPGSRLVAEADRHGHCVLCVVRESATIAAVHHDGSVTRSLAAA